MKHSWKVGVIGDFNPKNRSHVATNEALTHAANHADMVIAVQWIPTPSLETAVAETLRPYDALWCSPGSPYQSMVGALNAIRFARERNMVQSEYRGYTQIWVCRRIGVILQQGEKDDPLFVRQTYHSVGHTRCGYNAHRN